MTDPLDAIAVGVLRQAQVRLGELPGPCLVPDLDEDAYHAHDALGSTDLKHLNRSPAHWRAYRAHPPVSTRLDEGSAVHALLLGGPEIRIVEYTPAAKRKGETPAPVHAQDWKSPNARAAADELRAQGIIPMTVPAYDRAQRTAEAVLAHPDAAELLDLPPAGREVSVFWENPTPLLGAADGSDPVACKARLDGHHPGRAAVDVKTTDDVRLDALARVTARLLYDVQAVHYLTGLIEAGAESDWLPWVHIWVEREAPHAVTVTRLSVDALERGADLADRAVDTYARARRDDHWPGPVPTGIAELYLPRWATRSPDYLDLEVL